MEIDYIRLLWVLVAFLEYPAGLSSRRDVAFRKGVP